MYPHPDIFELFAGMRRETMVAGDCVASWASIDARGLKVSRSDFPSNVIIGVYGGKITREKGPYVLDVSMRGEVNRMVDAHPDHGEEAILGRINEDIHTNHYNTCLDIAGITYTIKPI